MYGHIHVAMYNIYDAEECVLLIYMYQQQQGSGIGRRYEEI